MPPVKNLEKAKAIKKRGQEPMRQALYRMSGVDVTQIDAIGVETVDPGTQRAPLIPACKTPPKGEVNFLAQVAALIRIGFITTR